MPKASRAQVKPERAKVPAKKWTTPLAHPSYSIEPCPNCRFPEADGGYCPECGWSLPAPRRSS